MALIILFSSAITSNISSKLEHDSSKLRSVSNQTKTVRTQHWNRNRSTMTILETLLDWLYVLQTKSLLKTSPSSPCYHVFSKKCKDFLENSTNFGDFRGDTQTRMPPVGFTGVPAKLCRHFATLHSGFW